MWPFGKRKKKVETSGGTGVPSVSTSTPPQKEQKTLGKRPKYLDVNIEDYEPTYPTLGQLLTHEIPLRSQDVLRLTITCRGEEYYLYTYDGYVQALMAAPRPLKLNERLAWSKHALDQDPQCLSLCEESHDQDDYRFHQNRTAYPHLEDTLHTIYRVTSINNALALDDALQATQGKVAIKRNLISTEEIIQDVISWDFLHLSSQEMISHLSLLREVEAKTSYRLSMIETDWNEGNLHVGKEVPEPSRLSDEERYLYHLAQQESPAEGLRSAPQGFAVAWLMEALEVLLHAKTLGLALPDNATEDDFVLPLIDDVDAKRLLDQQAANLKRLREEGWIAMPGKEPELVEEYISTENLAPIDMTAILNNATLSEEQRQELQDYAAHNEKLEHHLQEVEQALQTQSDTYLTVSGDYDEMRFERDLKVYTEDFDELQEGDTSEEPEGAELVETRDNANDALFVLEDLERTRHSLNLQRLQGLRAMISILESAPLQEDVMKVMAILSSKIASIEHVKNIAYSARTVTELVDQQEEEQQHEVQQRIVLTQEEALLGISPDEVSAIMSTVKQETSAVGSIDIQRLEQDLVQRLSGEPKEVEEEDADTFAAAPLEEAAETKVSDTLGDPDNAADEAVEATDGSMVPEVPVEDNLASEELLATTEALEVAPLLADMLRSTMELPAVETFRQPLQSFHNQLEILFFARASAEELVGAVDTPGSALVILEGDEHKALLPYEETIGDLRKAGSSDNTLMEQGGDEHAQEMMIFEGGPLHVDEESQ